MTTSGWGAEATAVALAAVVVFWMVGAYNRLIALRNAIGEAFAQVDDVLKRRAAAIDALHGALQRPLHAEHGALAALAVAATRVRGAADAVRAHPASPPAVAALAAAEAAMGAASSRVLALAGNQTELRADPAVAPRIAELADAATRLAFARQLFNDAVAAYNEASRLFPTRLLARLYGLGPAAPL